MKFGSLFSGIGGFDLGFEWAGMECAWQVEIDDFATKVLERHWPDVPKYRDIKDCGKHNLQPVDLICGGFPCQPHSLAGKRKGSNDTRDLWAEFARIIRELRPRFVVAENVPGLLSSESGRFFGRVLSDLAACGYDAEWQCIPASAFGAPHRRDRVWLVAYSNSIWQSQQEGNQQNQRGWIVNSGKEAANTNSARCQGYWQGPFRGPEKQSMSSFSSWWKVEPNVGRVVVGLPNRSHRLRCLGNAVVPQIVEWLGRNIMKEASSEI